MKFNKLKFTGLQSIELPIEGARPSDPYIIKTVDGLGPPEIDVFLAETRDAGLIYQGSRPQSREIVARIGLNPDHGSGQTAAELRASVYGLLTPGASGDVRVDLLDNDSVVAFTRGYTKRVEVVPFSEEPEVQVTMPCLKAYLQAPNTLYVPAGGTKAAPIINNAGTAETGFHFEVTFNAPTSGWTLTQDNGAKMELNYDFAVGDRLVIDTRPGLRGIWVTASLVTTNRISALMSGSSWLMLHGGDNAFTTSSQDFDWGDIFYQPVYWGV